METVVLLTLLVLSGGAVLFITGVVRVDVAAALVTLALAWLGLVTPVQALSGFSSSAVIAMLSVMVLGRGLDRTGVTVRIARAIVGLAGRDERRLTAAVSLVAGGISAFMQSVPPPSSSPCSCGSRRSRGSRHRTFSCRSATLQLSGGLSAWSGRAPSSS